MRVPFFLILILSFAALSAQDWEHYYGLPSKKESSKDVLESYDKGYNLIGRIWYETTEWQYDSWLIKTDINGNLLWDKELLNSDNYVFVNAIDQIQDGGFVICGSFIEGGFTYPFILKLNACGELEWCHRFTGAMNELPWADDVKVLPNGNIALLVNMFGDGARESMHLFMLDSLGSTLWQNPYCSGFVYDLLRPLGDNLGLTNDNKIIISGTSYWKHPWEPQSEYYWLRPTFTMVDPATGEEEWVLPIGLQDTITGEAYDFVEIDENFFTGISVNVSPTNIDAQLGFVKFNNNGAVLNYKKISAQSIDQTFSEGACESINLIDGYYYLDGAFEIGYTENIIYTNLKIDTNLFYIDDPEIFYQTHENKAWPFATDITFDDKIISAATFKEPDNWDIFLTKLNTDLEQDSIYTAPYEYDYLCPESIQSGIISLDGCFPAGVEEEDIPTPQDYLAALQTIPVRVFPNPASDVINLEFENTGKFENLKLKVFNVQRVLLESQPMISGQKGSQLNVSQWPQGIYGLFIFSNEKVVGKARFMVK